MKTLRFVFALLSLLLLVSDNVQVFSAPLKTNDLLRDLLFQLKESEVKVKIKVLCDFCTVAVDTIRKLVELKTSEKLIEIAVIKACETMHVEDHYICSSIVPVFKDEVLYVFDNTALSTREICGTILNDNCGQTYDPFNQTWSISIPGGKPPIVPPSPPKSGSPTNRILHISDIHWDPNYTVGLTTQCGEPICCRPPNAKASGSEDYAHQWGSYHCDLSYPTFINFLEHLNQTTDQFDWIYLTGDLPAHNDWEQNKTGQLYILKTVVNKIKSYLPGKPIFFSVGNHESTPVNSFPPPFIPAKYSDAWLYDAAADLFKEWLPEDAMKTFKYAGYFSIDYKGFRIISLQTNFCNSGNWWLLINDTDPAGMLQWLVQRLSDAEAKGLKVHILGHIPPDNCLKPWDINYQKIILRYENVIAGQFFGHCHIDSFRVMLDIQDNIARPFGVVYLGPGVTTAGTMNPGYRIYTVDGTYNGSSRQVLDHETYYMNLTDANISNKPKWNFEYSAKKSYNLIDFSAKSWFNLVKRFQSDHNVFLQYYHYQFKMANPTAQCNDGCESYTKCTLVTTYTKDNACQFLNPKSNISNYNMMSYLKSIQYC